jgi:K+-sensing histidine kinase KdpD
LPRDLPLVRIDALLIERVLVNLLENASKYTPRAARSPVGRSGRRSAEHFGLGRWARPAPGTRGSGVPEIHARRTRVRHAGSGLGLAICRAIVESHQGKIFATNRPGGGAKFTFTLPLGDPARRRSRGRGCPWLRASRSPFSSRTNVRFAVSCARRWRPKVGACTRPTPCGRA